MNTKSTHDPVKPKPEINVHGFAARVLIQAALVSLLLALLLFLPAGRLDWYFGWVMLGLYVIGNFGTMLLLLRFEPDLAKERIEIPGEIKKWDRVLTGIPKVLLLLVMLPLAGLDIRFGWTRAFPVALQLAALVIYALAQVLITWAMMANRFFASAVRIQTERGHSVVTHGPYRVVRHPGYVGMIIQMLAAPLALGSWWAMIPGTLSAGCYVVRTALEDQTLRQELAGYEAYANQVHYRLIPGIW
jgi:protein-S-isoprenylcysteine O-methyltransferase Ste14